LKQSLHVDLIAAFLYAQSVAAPDSKPRVTLRNGRSPRKSSRNGWWFGQDLAQNTRFLGGMHRLKSLEPMYSKG
jgi:hypothetical protein